MQAELGPLRLAHRILIKDTVRAVVLQSQDDAQSVLARYGMRPSQLQAWQAAVLDQHL